jgi:alkaline phosphatase
MTQAAINILDDDPDGFTLVVEGGAIDWAAHAAPADQPGRMIEELVDFNQAVEAVVSWVESNSSWADTLVVVTGDHETGYLWGPGSDPAWQPLVNHGAGVLPGMQFHTDNHSNSLIAIYARGEGAQAFAAQLSGFDPVRGSYVDNTRIAQVVFKSFSAYQAFLPFVGR